MERSDWCAPLVDGTGDVNKHSYRPVLSADGSTVVFASWATNLDVLDTNDSADTFLWNAATGVRLVSVNKDGTGSGNYDSGWFPSVISADGSTIAFQSFADNLVPLRQ